MSFPTVESSLSSSVTLTSTGTVTYNTGILLTINPFEQIGINNLSLGFCLDSDWKTWRDSPTYRTLTEEANFKIIRFFTHKSGSPKPCTNWNEATKTGTWSWAETDLLVQRIYEVGAEPLIILGGSRSTGMTGAPKGMTINPTTGLPNPQSWAAYCNEWVKHFKQTGRPVRFYEMMNEPFTYFASNGWSNLDYTKLGHYKTLFSAAYTAMHQTNSQVKISFDFSCHKDALNWWIDNGGQLDTLNFHKYDEYRYPYASDSTMIGYAETKFFGSWPLGGYSVTDAQDRYEAARGQTLPIINSESNMNSKYIDGADPRLQTMVGATWLASVLRMGILNGVSYNIGYSFSSTRSIGEDTVTGGFGFGMVNKDDGVVWYPYLVNYLIGKNISVGDAIIDSTSGSDDVRVVAWVHEGALYTFIINRVDDEKTVQLSGIQGPMQIYWIDATVSHEYPALKQAIIDSNQVTLKGYTVMLIQTTS